MRRNRQRGMTLVELLVGMAVTSILLVGLTSAFFNVSSLYQNWADRIQSASIGTDLAANLQVDAHRYVYCNQNQAGVPAPFLDLCAPDDLQHPVITYQVNGSHPWVITRQVAGASATFLARSATPPEFWIDCLDGGGAVSGHIHLYGFRRGDGLGGASTENYSVYYEAPWRQGC